MRPVKSKTWELSGTENTMKYQKPDRMRRERKANPALPSECPPVQSRYRDFFPEPSRWLPAGKDSVAWYYRPPLAQDRRLSCHSPVLTVVIRPNCRCLVFVEQFLRHQFFQRNQPVSLMSDFESSCPSQSAFCRPVRAPATVT